ncbi:putative GTP-binding protein 6 [Atheta coriaria]|uniref:putative GTP-binding protein 6 n=1 Tax=Dalotia coriaria TaxID=877792 RepID=UPI0031F44921
MKILALCETVSVQYLPPELHRAHCRGLVWSGRSKREYNQLSEQCFGLHKDYNCFIIHPYIKWGPKKVSDTNPTRQLEEAAALIRTLAPWKVNDTLAVPLETLDKKEIFGSGTVEKLKQTVRRNQSITAVFINVSRLKSVQLEELEKIFQVPIFDRYKIVMQILRLHAITKHAKLQVALAEIPYLRANIKKHDSHFMAASNFDTRRQMLQNRENKIKGEIKKLRGQRELLRKRRRDIDYPVIAVVGYTNAGKTSIIKALTGDGKLKPRNQLFATLDVTMHAGLLPCNLEVLFVDTVGFISDIPTNLIECFVATLEDALYADVILHVEDLSSEDYLFQRRHVMSTLENLALQTDTKQFQQKMITVGNKMDISPLKSTESSGELCVSAKTLHGLPELTEKLQDLVISQTNRIVMTIRVPTGGDEIRWLYKNAAVVDVTPDDNQQRQNARVVITRSKLQQFKHHFVQ